MRNHPPPAIHRVIDHVGNATELARRLGVPPQHVLIWKKRRWASPVHILSIEPHMPEGMTLRDLHQDRLDAQAEEARRTKRPKRAASEGRA